MREITAEIIASPSRSAPMADAASPAASLARLNAVLGEHRRAVATWRDRLDRLPGGVGVLQAGFPGLQDRLGTVQGRLAELEEASRRLQQWADQGCAQI